MDIAVNCSFVGKVDADLGGLVCAEFIDVLSQNFPDESFHVGTSSQGRLLDVFFHSATKNRLSLNLKWSSASGRVWEGERVAVVIADRKLDVSMRSSLYRRAIAALPPLN